MVIMDKFSDFKLGLLFPGMVMANSRRKRECYYRANFSTNYTNSVRNERITECGVQNAQCSSLGCSLVVTMGQHHGLFVTGRHITAVSTQTDTAAAAHTSRRSLCVVLYSALCTPIKAL